MEIAFALDTPLRLARTGGGSTKGQSLPNTFANPLTPAFELSVGSRVIYKGNVWRLLVCVLATVLVVASLLAYEMASTQLTFGLLVGSFFAIPCAVGVLAHTGRLTDD